MLPAKLRSATPIQADRPGGEDESGPQDKSFQALSRGQFAPHSVDNPHVNLRAADDDTDHDTDHDGGDSEHEGAIMQADSGNPAHNPDTSPSQGLAFGFHITHDSDSDDEMSDDEGGGAALVDPAASDGDYQMNISAQTVDSHYQDVAPPGLDVLPAAPSAPGGQPGNYYVSGNGNMVLVNAALPFGFVPVEMEVQPLEVGAEDVPNGPPPGPAHTPPVVPDEADMQPLMPSSTNPMIMGSENVGLVDFLRSWAHWTASTAARTFAPDIRSVHAQANRDVREVGFDDLQGDSWDVQGLDWSDMNTTRAAARTRRRYLYTNYVNMAGSDRWTVSLSINFAPDISTSSTFLMIVNQTDRRDTWIPSTESYFRFRRMTMQSDVSLAHFQLRSALACPSRSQAYYACPRGINRFNPISRKKEPAVSLAEFPALGCVVTTLDANCGVLVGGTYSGTYVVKSLHSEDKEFSQGAISPGHAGITNHLQIHTPRRSSSPVAAISSNDEGFRVMDIQTEQFISDFLYEYPINCSVVSPDRRLRALVGDTKEVVIANAETGETEVELTGHRDYGFACDWSEDGRTVATGFQDKSVKIWDTRKWTDSRGVGTPVASLWCDLAGARSLRFSPLGGGEPVLVAAEEADYINIIDARSFQKKQTIDLFGEIAGVAFTDEGQELNVLVSDPHRGGLLQFDRCGPSKGARRPWAMEHMPPF